MCRPDKERNNCPQPPVSDEGGDRGRSGDTAWRIHASRRPRETRSPGGVDDKKKDRRDAAVTAQLVSAASRNTIRRSSAETCPVQSEAKYGSRRSLR